MIDRSGEKMPCVRVWRRTRARCSWFSRPNSATSRGASVYARTTGIPLRFSWVLFARRASCSWTATASAWARVL